MARILGLALQGAFAVIGTSLFLYVVLARPLSFEDAGVMLSWGIGCLSLALALTWASVFRNKRLARNRD